MRVARIVIAPGATPRSTYSPLSLVSALREEPTIVTCALGTGACVALSNTRPEIVPCCARAADGASHAATMSAYRQNRLRMSSLSMAVHEIVPERGIVVDAGSRVDPAKKTARRGCLCAN